jgi:signal transduction histidine kinase
MSGELKEQSIIGHIAWRVIFALIIVFGLFVIFDPIWVLAPVRVGLHTLLAFLAFIGAAVISYDIQKNSIFWKYLLLSVFVFTAMVNLVAALWHLNPFYYIDEIMEVSADLIEMMLLELLILSAIIPTKFTQSKITVPNGLVILFSLILGALAVYGVGYYLLLPIISPLLSGIGFGIINITLNITIFMILTSRAQSSNRWDKITFTTGLLLMFVSTICLLLSYILPTNLLVPSIMIRAAMMYSLFMAVALPVQSQINISQKNARLNASLGALLTVVPYVLTVLIVSIIPIAWIFPEQGIYTLSHLIVAVLAAIIVRLLWLFTKQQPHWHRYPLILLFVCVTILESTIFILSPWVELTGEFTLLYILTGIIVVIWLLQALRWLYHPPTQRQHSKMVWWTAGYSAVMLIIILGGVWLQTSLDILFHWVDLKLIYRSVLLGVCFVSIFLVTYLFLLFLQVSKGKMTMGIVVLGTVNLWVIANMIRVNFVDWTAGWWVAQFVLLFGFMMGPATLGRLYLSTLESSEQERKRATLYADILIHDLRNYHTVIQSSLDLLALAQDASEVIDEVTDQMQLAIDRANRLITNVRSLELAQSLQPKDLVRTDLVAVINEAWEHVLNNDDDTIEFQINRKVGDCFVQGNNLLLEVFINLFRNALKYSEDVKRVHIDIQPVKLDNKQCWEIRVTDWGKGIPPEQMPKLFTRYSEGAKGLGLGLSVVKSLVDAFHGSISVENRRKEDYTEGTVFIITLPYSP